MISNCSRSLSTLGIICHSNGRVSIVLSIYVSLMISDVEHLFMSLFVICNHLYWNIYSDSLPILIRLSFTISQSDLPFHFVKSFQKQKILIIINSNLVVLFLMVWPLCFKRSLLNPRSWNWKRIQNLFSIVKQSNQKNLEIVVSTNPVLSSVWWCL